MKHVKKHEYVNHVSIIINYVMIFNMKDYNFVTLVKNQIFK